MNGLEVIVLGIILLSCFMGYRTGFLRVVYSLFSWLIVLAFVTWSTPYLTDFLEKNTSLQVAIEEKCSTYIEEKVKEKVQEQTEEHGEEHGEEQIEGLETLEDAEIWLPEDIMEEISGSTADVVNQIIQTSGVHEEIAESIAHFVMEGIAFFIALIIAGIFIHWITRILDLVSHLPVLHGVNKTLGAAAGGLKGLVIVWLLFYIITLCGTSEVGTQFLSYIKESPVLLFLYKNNILMEIIMIFL